VGEEDATKSSSKNRMKQYLSYKRTPFKGVEVQTLKEILEHDAIKKLNEN
jgi:hypothetical protein